MAGFFETLATLLGEAGSAVAMNVVSLKDGQLSVQVMPTGKWKDPALGTGLSVKGTPQELDEGLVEQIARYRTARMSLAEQVDNTVAVLEAAEKAQKEKAAAAVKKVSTTAATKTVAPSATKSKSVEATVQAGSATPGEAPSGTPKEVELF